MYRFCKYFNNQYSRLSTENPEGMTSLLPPPPPDKVHFVVGKPEQNKVFSCDMKLLLESSPVWTQMLKESENGNEETSGFIIIPDVSPQVFADVLKIIKQGPMKQLLIVKGHSMVTQLRSPMTMLRIAMKYQLNSLLSVCRENILNSRILFMHQGVTMYEIVKQTMNYDCDLSVRRLKYIEDRLIRCFEQLMVTKAFEEFSQESLCFFLGHNDLFVHKELDLLNCCVKWAKAKCRARQLHPNAENTRRTLGGIVELIRFPLFAEDYDTEVAPLQILDPEESANLRTYWHLLKTDKKAAMAMNLPYIKVRRIGQLFNVDLYPPSEGPRVRYCHPGAWKQIKLTCNRPVEIDTLIFSGKLEGISQGNISTVRMMLKFKEKCVHDIYGLRSTQTVIGHLRDGNIITLRPMQNFQLLPDNKYKLKFQFLDRTITNCASLHKQNFILPEWKRLSVSCGQRRNVIIETCKDSQNNFFRGFHFRLLSKILPTPK